MSSALNLRTMADAAPHRDPYRHFVYGNAFGSDAFAQELLATFPDEGYEWQIEYKIDQAIGVDERRAARHKKRMRVVVDVEHPEVIDPHTLSEPWRKVLAEILAPDYRNAMKTLTGVDVHGLSMLVHFWRFAPGSFFRPHVDKPHKLVTHLFFFGEGWQPEWGGQLRMLRGPDLDAVVAEYPPTLNTAVIHVRSDDAWHGVSQLAFDCPKERLVFQVWFHA